MRSPIPALLATDRLILRRWSGADAAALGPLLITNAAHIAPWIPARIATPAPLDELVARLTGFAGDFDAGRAFRYALYTRDATRLLGKMDLFVRNASGRVPLSDGDHVELGYWLDIAATGQGYATEACRTLLTVAAGLPGMRDAVIRCDPANAPSAAVPQRLGFSMAATEDGTQVWKMNLAARAAADLTGRHREP